MNEHDEWDAETSVDALKASVLPAESTEAEPLPPASLTIEERLARLETQMGEALQLSQLAITYMQEISATLARIFTHNPPDPEPAE